LDSLNAAPNKIITQIKKAPKRGFASNIAHWRKGEYMTIAGHNTTFGGRLDRGSTKRFPLATAGTDNYKPGQVVGQPADSRQSNRR
jgi:hypothetical protein